MVKYYCDRCGGKIEPRLAERNILVADVQGFDSRLRIRLCGECAKFALDELMKACEEEENAGN